jgi:hypothetical protein
MLGYRLRTIGSFGPEEFNGEVVSSGSDNKITIFRIAKGKKLGKERVFTEN